MIIPCLKTVLLFIVVTLLGCNNNHHHEKDNRAAYQIESIDISPDDQNLLVLCNRDGVTTLFEVNAEGQSPKLVLKASDDELFASPRYSPDGKKIVFIKHFKKNFWESTVCISNRDGTNIQELTHGGELVTEAIFSGVDIIYCSSKQYNTSKERHSSDAHKFNIYAIDARTRITTQLSEFDALGIDNLSEVNEKFILFHVNAGKKSGIWSFEKNNPGKPLRIFPANGTWDSNQLDKPGYVPDKFLAFTALSELYVMNLNTHKADLIYDAKKGHLIELLRAFHTQSRVLFKKFDEQSFTSLNTGGSELRSIDIVFPSDLQ